MANSNKIIQKVSAIKLRITDSNRNCTLICLLNTPTTFLNPISRARKPALAVERFTKFILDIKRIKNAINEKE